MMTVPAEVQEAAKRIKWLPGDCSDDADVLATWVQSLSKTDHSDDYAAALEDECARANALIGVLRLAASKGPQARVGEADYPLYTQYRTSREHRLGVLETAEQGGHIGRDAAEDMVT